MRIVTIKLPPLLVALLLTVFISEPASSQYSALFVIGDPAPEAGDPEVVGALENMGFEVTIVEDSPSVTEDADGMDLIVISSTVSSGNVGPKFRDVAVPAVVWESYVYDDMQMTGPTSDGDFGNVAEADWTTQVQVLDDTHPIATGYSTDEVVEVYTDAAQMVWGMPSFSTVVPILALPDTDTFVTFAYDAGDEMVELAAPARRVGFFFHDDGTAGSGPEVATADAWKLFDNAILWATGRESEIAPEGGFMGGGVAAERPGAELPTSFEIEGVYPNPFNPRTSVVLNVRDVGAYQVRTFDVLGHMVRSQRLHAAAPGEVTVELELGIEPSGLYFISVMQERSGAVQTAKAVLLK